MTTTTIKNFAIIKTTTNMVLLTISGDETQIAVDYEGFTIVEIPMPTDGVRNISAGMLYHDNKFWIDVSSFSQSSNVIVSRSAFRKLFTSDELVKIDNYNNDNSLTLAIKSQFKTFMIELDGMLLITLTSNLVSDYLTFLVSIGYLEEARKIAIIAGTSV